MNKINFINFAFTISELPKWIKVTNNYLSYDTANITRIKQTFVSINTRELIFLMELKETTILN